MNLNIFPKLIISAFGAIFPISAALLFSAYLNFRLLYITDDRSTLYYGGNLIKMAAAVGLVGFIEVTNIWLWASMMLYFVSDSVITYERYQIRKELVAAEDAEALKLGKKNRPKGSMFSIPYLSRFIPYFLVSLIALAFNFWATKQGERDKLTDKRFIAAQELRIIATEALDRIECTVNEFVLTSVKYWDYQEKLNKISDQRLQRLEKANGLTPATSATITAPAISIDTAAIKLQTNAPTRKPTDTTGFRR